MTSRLFIVLFALSALLAHPLCAQDAPLTTRDVMRLEQVGSVAISPDGAWIAFTKSVPRDPKEKNGGSHSELHVVSSAGGATRGFLTGDVSVGALDWTGDSKRIVFSMRKPGESKTKLYAIRIDGGESQELLDPAESIRSWSLSPDGRYAAYTCLEPADSDRKKESARGFDRIIYEEEERSVQTWIYDFSAKSHRRLDVKGAAWEIGFSPDSKSLAAWISPTARVDDRYMEKSLWVTDVQDGVFRQVAPNPGKVGNFAWSPDSKRLAFITADDINDPKESQLAMVDAKGGAVKRLSDSAWEGHRTELTWMDANTLGYLAQIGCETAIMTMSVDDGSTKTLIEGGAGIWAHWSLSADAKTAAFVGDSSSHPREVFAAKLGQESPRRLTVSNGWLAQRKLAKQEVVRYPARDGLEIEGILIHPLEEQDGPVPLIMVIHGGPEAHYSNGWLTAYSMPGQVAAGKNYAVFYPNYRSSTGRGVAFSKLGQGRSALEEFDDIVDGIDFLAAKKLVDPKKVGITGGSYGGYASAWAATFYSDRFAASVMFVGISDQISKVFTTDIPKESYLVHWRMRPWGGNWQKFLESSPIYYIEKAKTPILICHGQDDPRVSPTQSVELYRALKLKGDVPVRLVMYPGEGHGNRKRAARLDYALRQMRWFDHYLMGPGGEKPAAGIDYGE